MKRTSELNPANLGAGSLKFLALVDHINICHIKGLCDDIQLSEQLILHLSIPKNLNLGNVLSHQLVSGGQKLLVIRSINIYALCVVLSCLVMMYEWIIFFIKSTLSRLCARKSFAVAQI